MNNFVSQLPSILLQPFKQLPWFKYPSNSTTTSVTFIIQHTSTHVVVRLVELVRNLVAHGDAREEKWRGNWRMEWVASTLTPPPNVVYPALLKLMRTPRLPAVDWTDAPTDLNGLVRFGERRNPVSARVPSRSARAIALLLLNREVQDSKFSV